MANLIQNEALLSMNYLLQLEDDGTLVLSPDNVARVEAMIQMNSSYRRSYNVKAAPHNKYGGSTAYWMTQLVNALTAEDVSEEDYRNIVLNAVSAVDRDNSTHLNADSVGRNQVTDRIVSIPNQELIDHLERGDMYVFDIIAQKTNADNRARRNPSFASKFCHFLCYYLFQGKKQQDNYCIYDSIVKKALPQYAKHYCVDVGDLEDYSEYIRVVSCILSKLPQPISRNGFDQLLWYYHKGEE